jgi:uncharacterized protein (TIGR02284 family)
MTDRIDALKTLLTRLIDSREGYRESIEHVRTPALKSIFEEFMARRDRDASEVRAWLTQSGHTADDDGSILASAHRTFTSLKDSVTGGSDEQTLAEVIRGEKTLLDAYEKALEAAGGADPEFGWLSEQHAGLKATIMQLETRHDLAAE